MSTIIIRYQGTTDVSVPATPAAPTIVTGWEECDLRRTKKSVTRFKEQSEIFFKPAVVVAPTTGWEDYSIQRINRYVTRFKEQSEVPFKPAVAAPITGWEDYNVQRIKRFAFKPTNVDVLFSTTPIPILGWEENVISRAVSRITPRPDYADILPPAVAAPITAVTGWEDFNIPRVAKRRRITIQRVAPSSFTKVVVTPVTGWDVDSAGLAKTRKRLRQDDSDSSLLFTQVVIVAAPSFGWYGEVLPIVKRPRVRVEQSDLLRFIDVPISFGWHLEDRRILKRPIVRPEQSQSEVFFTQRPLSFGWYADDNRIVRVVRRQGEQLDFPLIPAAVAPSINFGWYDDPLRNAYQFLRNNRRLNRLLGDLVTGEVLFVPFVLRRLAMKDCVLEKSTSTGLGSFALSGAVDGFTTFAIAGVQDGDMVDYSIRHQSAIEWEAGRGIYVAATPAISRTTVTQSSSGPGIMVNFSGGLKHVALTLSERFANDLPMYIFPPPANSSSPGFPGQKSYDASFEYVCVALNTWRRIAISAF